MGRRAPSRPMTNAANDDWDRSLAARCREWIPDDEPPRDIEALREWLIRRLYERHAADMCRVIGRIVLDRELAYDCLHDVFVDLPRRLMAFDGRGDIGHWLLKVSVRVALDEVRRRRRRRRLLGWLQRFWSVEDRRGPMFDAVANERRAAIEAALSHEPVLDRAVLVLTSMEGMSYSDAGAALGLSVEAVRGRHKRVRNRLAARLGPSLEDL
jgi:RNA polymerase sigma-70 factor (ECF subfamily)